jgi:hypothetical protein
MDLFEIANDLWNKGAEYADKLAETGEQVANTVTGGLYTGLESIGAFTHVISNFILGILTAIFNTLNSDFLAGLISFLLIPTQYPAEIFVIIEIFLIGYAVFTPSEEDSGFFSPIIRYITANLKLVEGAGRTIGWFIRQLPFW